MRTNFSLSILLAFVLWGTALLADNHDSGANFAKKNTVYVEGLGVAPWVSLNYDRIFADDKMSIRVGVGYFKGSILFFKTTAISIPVQFNYIGLASGNHIFELGGGLDIVYYDVGSKMPIDGTLKFEGDQKSVLSGLGIGAFGSVGYRYQSDNINFRAGGVFSANTIMNLHPFLSVGYSF